METASFRLPPTIVSEIRRVAQRRGRPRSEIVREALQQYLEAQRQKLTTSELVDELLGDHPGSGRRDLATRSEEILREKFRARRRSR